MQRTLVTLFSLLLTTPMLADFRDYEAPLDTANWKLDGSPIQCSLTQDIPYYGIASFTSAASRKSNMNFDLSLRRYNPTKITQAELSSEPPLWKHDQPRKLMGQITMFPGTIPVNIKNRNAWSLLTQLEQGMFPTFAYDSWLEDKDRVSVSLLIRNRDLEWTPVQAHWAYPCSR